jgi:hypothetical protein
MKRKHASNMGNIFSLDVYANLISVCVEIMVSYIHIAPKNKKKNVAGTRKLITPRVRNK